LAFIEGAKPRTEMEAALAMQMACTHAANMIVLGRLAGGSAGERRVVAISCASARLSQAFAAQMEAYRRLRNGGSQFATVLDAVDLGYRVILVRDGVSSSSDEGYDALLTVYHRRYSLQIETANAEEVLRLGFFL
jgi:hypothetical protein